jgi:hypothetical protein
VALAQRGFCRAWSALLVFVSMVSSLFIFKYEVKNNAGKKIENFVVERLQNLMG